MLQLCMPGEDAHCYMGSRIFDLNYQETMAKHKLGSDQHISGPQGVRMLGKVSNLSLQYRTSPPRLRTTARVDYNIPMTTPQSEHVHSTYKTTYRGVPLYWRRQIDRTKASGYAETMAGRRVRVEGDWGNMGWAMGSTAINYCIQGTGADQKYLAIACLKDMARAHGAQMAWDLHDGLYWFVPEAQVESFARAGKAVLDALPYQRAWGFKPPVPMTWDCATGPSWGLMRKFEL
jgi:DNA polymerase I-like protein with 3'-5' exonuclease and polymerase domains